MFENIASSFLGYLLGSLHLTYFAAKKLANKDLSREGTRNIGATNAFIVGGKFFGIMALIFDIGKGNKILGIEILNASKRIKPKNMNYLDFQIPVGMPV